MMTSSTGHRWLCLCTALLAGLSVIAWRAGEHNGKSRGRMSAMPNSTGDDTPRVVKTEQEWKQRLSPEQYHVTREKGTERAFTGRLLEQQT